MIIIESVYHPQVKPRPSYTQGDLLIFELHTETIVVVRGANGWGSPDPLPTNWFLAP